MTQPWQHWDVHASVALGLAVLGGLYVLLGGLRARPRQVVAFAGALLVLLGTLNGPLHDLSDSYLFSAHMVQHLLLTMAFPPLLLYGTPVWTARRVVGLPGARPFLTVLTRPVVAAFVFSAVMAAWHFPGLYEAAMRNHDLHIVQHLTFMASAVLVWWPVLSPVPELPRIPYPAQMLYLFMLGIPMSIVGAIITFTQRVLYPFYLEAPRLWLDPLVDQQVGGLIMWIPGGLVFWAAMTVVWFRWAAREERGDVEREVPIEAYGGQS
ncbi:MAG: cytochrome c oxidase assembly protein [Gemmatimonadales bacterium]